ncbi:MAG: uroporphyrinogen-III synthase [Epsilonproteobacteria bacterium]|nr:uroporphyrinogen-III synthase [Campylobacterota bacterium]
MGIIKNKVEQGALLPIYLFSLTPADGVVHIPTLDVTYFQPKIDFSVYDYLILTSKQAIEALKHYPKEEYIHIPALCISKATANAYRALGGEVLEEAKGYGDSLVEYVQKFPKTIKWLYLRASVVASDFVSILQEEGFRVDQEVVYATQCSKAIAQAKIPSNAVLIFTSPSSVECFLVHHSFEQTHKAIVIGKTTAKLLENIIPYKMPKNPTIKACISLAKELL